MSRHARARAIAVLAGLTAAGVMVAPAAAYAGKSRPTSDRTAPHVSIGSPASGATVGSPVTVTGTATDDRALSRVTVAVDAGSPTAASGTSTWSWTSPSLAAGSHTVVAAAYDTSGNVASTSVTVSVGSSSSTSTTTGDVVLNDPKALNPLQLLGRGRAAEWGTVGALLYWETSTSRNAVFFRDASTGASSYVDLPSSSSSGWSDAAYTMTSATDLWVFGGNGPMVLRHYQLAGGGVPTSASLLTAQTLGDTDSRPGDLVRLASGAVVAEWHQQGATGPEGMWVAYAKATGTAQVLGPYTFAMTRASKQVLAQHPADGSVWLFTEADSSGTVATATFTESAGALSLRSTDGAFLNVTKYGYDGPDSENPDLAVAPDASTGTLVLAYQDAHRTMFQTSPTVVTGSFVSLARIPATGTPSFSQLPVYVERISSLAVVVQPGAVWLAYRPIDTTTMTYDHLWWNVQRNGAWGTAVELGQLATPMERLSFGISRPTVSTQMADGLLHVFALS